MQSLSNASKSIPEDGKNGSEESGEQVMVIAATRGMGAERSRVQTWLRNELAYKSFEWKAGRFSWIVYR